MLAIALLLTVALQVGDSASTAFIGVNVVRSDRPGVATSQTVIVEGKRIAWVGSARAAVLKPTTRRIDASGKYLLAGFADMHVHIGGRGDLLTYIANGITTVRNMYGGPRHLAWRDSIRAGKLLGPRIVTSGAILDGNPPSQPDMTVLTDPATVRAEVERQIAAGYDFIKVYNSLSKAVYDTIVRVAAEHHVPVAGHVPFEVRLSGALASNQRSIEHLRGYIAELVPADAKVQPGASLKSRSLAWNYVDTSRYGRLVQATARSNTWNCPTLSVTGELFAPPERWARMAKRPEYKYLNVQADRSQIPYLKDFSPDDYRDVQNGVGPQRQLVGALFRGGARLLAGTDSYLQGFALQNELEELAKSRITPWDVLMIATVNAARYLGEEGEWGEVAAGEFADLQLVDANPMRSLAALQQRSGVMVRGRWYPRAAIAKQLTQLAALNRTRQTNR